MVLTLFDWYSASYGLLMVAFCELIAVNWFYGKILFYIYSSSKPYYPCPAEYFHVLDFF